MRGTTPSTRLVFGDFELHTDSGELFRSGERVALQYQPAELLELLARRAGEVVSREEIRERIWGTETYVDAEQGINYCIRQIRQALDDEASDPRYVETVPRRGYRFVAPLEESRVAAPGGAAGRRPRRRTIALAVAGAALVAAALAYVMPGPGAPDDPGEEAPAPPSPAPLVVPEEAHSRFLEARYLIEHALEGDVVTDSTRAVELLQAVVQEVPEHAEAHAALGDAWLLRLDLPRPEAMERAEAAARRSLELDPDGVEARTVLAAALFFHRLDWDGAWQSLERALERDPDYPDAVFLRGLYLSALGRHDEALAAARRAARLDPGQLPGISIAWLYYFARRFDRAVDEAERILELDPLDEPSHQVLVLAHLARGDEAAAAREQDRFIRRSIDAPDDLPMDLPPVRELHRIWWENRHLEGSELLSPTYVASFGAVAGVAEGPVRYLRQACEERSASWDLPFLAVDPRWDGFRDDPAFQEVVDCVGVPGFARDAPVFLPPG